MPLVDAAFGLTIQDPRLSTRLDSSWRITFKRLSSFFSTASCTGPTLRHITLKPLGNHQPFSPAWEARFSNDTYTLTEMNPHWDSVSAYGVLYGPEEERLRFQQLAQWAWEALPGTKEGKAQAYSQNTPLGCWMAWVYRQMSYSLPSYILADEDLLVCYQDENGYEKKECFPVESVRRETPNGTMIEPGYPKAEHVPSTAKKWNLWELSVDPFYASVLTIDLLLAHPHPEGPYLISSRQMNEYQESEEFQTANHYVTAISLGEGRRFPIYRKWCMPVPGNTPTVCPNANPPGNEQDRQVLMTYLPDIENELRTLGHLQESETFHFVGRQVELSTLCQCDLSCPESDSPPSEDYLKWKQAEAQEQQQKEPKSERILWEQNELADIPAILDYGQHLRTRMINGYVPTIVSNASKIFEALWSAMRLQGGCVPTEPNYPVVTEPEALGDRLREGELTRRFNTILDDVVRWCDERMQGEPQPATDYLPNITLDDIDIAILEYLNEMFPLRKRLVDIEASEICSQKTAGSRLNRLIGFKLAHRQGKKGGATITDLGKKMLEK